MKRLEMIEHIEEYAAMVVSQFVDTFESSCPELYAMAADHLIARLVHTVIVVRDPDVLDARIPNEVHEVVGEMQGRLPALLARIITEAEQKETGSASH